MLSNRLLDSSESLSSHLSGTEGMRDADITELTELGAVVEGSNRSHPQSIL